MATPNKINKKKLIKSAKKCLVENGIENFTLRAVAELAGVTQGTIYYHFKTKEQIFLEIVQDICEYTWNELSHNDEYILKETIESAKSRCTHDSFYHKIFFTLVTASFNNKKIREQLLNILNLENHTLTKLLIKQWERSPVKGMSLDTWGILLNSIVDGLALQALIQKDFPVEKTYEELELLIKGLNDLLERDEII